MMRHIATSLPPANDPAHSWAVVISTPPRQMVMVLRVIGEPDSRFQAAFARRVVKEDRAGTILDDPIEIIGNVVVAKVDRTFVVRAIHHRHPQHVLTILTTVFDWAFAYSPRYRAGRMVIEVGDRLKEMFVGLAHSATIRPNG